METNELRTLMGLGATAALGLPGSASQITDTGWIALSGLPIADLNMALIQSGEPGVLASTLAAIATRGCPAVLLLAGDSRRLRGELPGAWTPGGEMPFMSIALDPASAVLDPRVRVAMPERDEDTVTELTAAAFGMDPGPLSAAVALTLAADPDVQRYWLLEDAGVPVSTLLSVRSADVVTLWSMATPADFTRRGYGRALLATVLAWAVQDGATLGLLGATPAGEPLYRASGWSEVESWEVFVNASSEQFPAGA